MITYAGVELPAPTEAVAAWVADHIRLDDIYEMWVPDAEGPSLKTYQTRSYPPKDLRVEIGTLSWPRGASRWALGHFLAHGTQLPAIRSAAYGGPSGSQSVPQPLVLGDGSRQISTNLYLLPPRPLAQLAEPNSLYLLTLVDERFYWWHKTADIPVTAGTTTWLNLLAAIGTALGTTIAVDPIPAAYMSPPASLTSHYAFLPPLLDAVAASVGQVIVRGLDGTVRSQSASSAALADQANLDLAFPVLAGGFFQTQ